MPRVPWDASRVELEVTRSMVLRLCLLMLLGVFLSSPAMAADDAATAARAVLKRHCLRCHAGPGSEGGEFHALEAASLTAARGKDPALVLAGKPDESLLLKKVVRGEMPPESGTDDLIGRPSAVEAQALRDWITNGATPFPKTEGRPRITPKDILKSVVQDLRQADLRDQPYLRYFTLSHLHNNPQVPDEDLRGYRAALSKTVNSLSWKNEIVLPRAIDTAETIFAIDLRDLDWDRKHLWEQILEVYPYGVRYTDSQDQELRQLDSEHEKLSGCPLSILRGDWFITQGTRPPLYHILLQLPTNAIELERRLGVNVNDNFLRDRLARAGFFPSGVSGQNRLVERHSALYGAYWKSYDFKKEGVKNDLKRFPLGPLFPHHPHPNQAFVHDGGEIIFNLPNGLQGYLLVDGKDQRIDAGPIAVVGDALKTSGTNEVINGQSCMSCHSRGVIPCADQLRTGSALEGQARLKLERLHPTVEQMNALLTKDRQRFLSAVELATAPYLKKGDAKDRPIESFAEPVGEIVRLYQLAPLDRQAVAAELGIADLEPLLKQVGEQRLREVGLGPLLENHALPRDKWETGAGMSQMQRVSRLLGVTPFEFVRVPE